MCHRSRWLHSASLIALLATCSRCCCVFCYMHLRCKSSHKVTRLIWLSDQTSLGFLIVLVHHTRSCYFYVNCSLLTAISLRSFIFLCCTSALNLGNLSHSGASQTLRLRPLLMHITHAIPDVCNSSLKAIMSADAVGEGYGPRCHYVNHSPSADIVLLHRRFARRQSRALFLSDAGCNVWRCGAAPLHTPSSSSRNVR